jgi:glycosyltransferase involved in cell wall biosynthesis
MNEDSNRTTSVTFVVFSDDWNVHMSSCQHIFRRIAKTHSIDWINTVGLRRPTLTLRDVDKARRKLSGMFRRTSAEQASTIDAEVEVHQPLMLPATKSKFVRRLNALSVSRTMRKIAARRGDKKIVIVTTVPNVCDYVDGIPNAGIVYYCVDDFSEWPGLDRQAVLDMESLLVEKSDVFLATSNTLFDRLQKSGKPTYYLPHGVDLDLFSHQAPRQHEVLDGVPAPRAGFFGLFDDRSDQALIAALAKAMPDISFVIAGSVETTIDRLESMDNVYFVGQIDYPRLPELISGMQVLLIPYHVNALSDALSPLKLKEYLVTGRRVVSTPIRAANEMKDIVVVAHSLQEWEAALRDGISSDIGKRREEMVSRLASESWDSKAEDMLRICNRHARLS